MQFPAFLATILALAAPIAAVAQEVPISVSGLAVRGKPLATSDKFRLGQITRVGADGSAAVIYDGRVVVIPGSSLSKVDGRLVTSLTRREVSELR